MKHGRFSPVWGAFAVCLAFPACAPAGGHERLLTAIRTVESGGNDLAVGDGGKALGPYQIHRSYWKDACEYAGVNWNYRTCVWDRAKCEQVIGWYWERYGAITDEQRIRMHQGGPRGPYKTCTLAYYRRVLALMQ